MTDGAGRPMTDSAGRPMTDSAGPPTVRAVSSPGNRTRNIALLGGTVLIIIAIVVGLTIGDHKKSSGTSPNPALVGCPTTSESKQVLLFKTAPPNCIPKASVWDVTFDTSEGTFVAQMNAAASYAAVNNFIFLTLWHYYDGSLFWRVVPGFVVQGGDPTGTGYGGPQSEPGYTFTGNTPPSSCMSAPGPSCYQPGDIAMANSNGPSTNASQFFFVLPGGQSTLDTEPNYTDFGHVISGIGVVDKIGTLGSSGGTPQRSITLLKVTATQVQS